MVESDFTNLVLIFIFGSEICLGADPVLFLLKWTFPTWVNSAYQEPGRPRGDLELLAELFFGPLIFVGTTPKYIKPVRVS